jgi:hypothetical protein
MKNKLKKILPVFIIMIKLISTAHAAKSCSLIDQDSDNNGNLICNYLCEDGSSISKYSSGYYCQPLIISN